MESTPQKYKAVVLGATGAVGGALLKDLVQSEKCESVIVLGRRVIPEWKENQKISAHAIDLEKWDV
jgi:hypothetical protein